MVKAKQHLLTALDNLLLKFCLIIPLNFAHNYSYTLDQKSKLSVLSPTACATRATIATKNIKKIQKSLAFSAKTLKFITSDTSPSDIIRIVKILEFLSPLSPPQFCEALDLIIPPGIAKIIVLSIMTHQRKCDYDHAISEYLAKNSFGDSQAISHVVAHARAKATGASARTRSSSLSLGFGTKIPDNFSGLSARFKAFGADLRTSWHNHLRLVQSSKPVATTIKLLSHTKSTHTVTHEAYATTNPITHTVYAEPQSASKITLLGEATERAPALSVNLTPQPIDASAYDRAKNPDLSRAEIAHAEYVQELIRRARYAPPPIRETLPLAQGPFYYGAELSSEQNSERYDQHIQPIQAPALAEQVISDRIRTRMVFANLAEDEFSVLLDRFAGIKPKKQIGANLIKKTNPSDMHDLMEDLHYVLRDSPARKTPTKTAPSAPWRPPQDYYCTTLYKHKLTRKPNI
ncbi:MAG TPA: hypothetical protein VJJ81_01535 [Candidatus Babeliales bacterium]|nr:hypothetical protein [Candidatus Babeliales bacterium]